MSLVLGSYDLGVQEETVFCDSISYALTSGIHYLDTAPNYYGGKAEAMIGKVLNAISVQNNDIRKQTKIFSKFGLLSNLQTPSDREPKGSNIWSGQDYDFTVERLASSVSNSLEQLGISQLECLFIHNPEAVCTLGLRAADVCKALIIPLQSLVEKQLISSWGISSWSGFYAHPQEPNHIPLKDLLAYADTVCEKEHFRFIQIPFGLWNLQTTMLTHQQNVKGHSANATECAHSHGLQVAINSILMQAETTKQCFPISDLPCIDQTMSEAEKQLVFCKNYSDADFYIIGMKSKQSVDANLRIFGNS